MRVKISKRAQVLAFTSLGLGAACGGGSRIPESMPREVGRLSGPEMPGPAQAAPELSEIEGRFNEFLAYALAKSPRARTAFEEWKAQVHSISRMRRLPEPMVSFGYYLREVETKAGPQRFRLGLQQNFPWPTKLSAGADAAASKARAAALRFDSQLLAIRREVARAYWELWLIQEEHRLKSEHDVVLESLAGAVRGRLQTGAASLADLNQVDLNIARHHDHHGQHEADRRKASAALLAAIGAESGGELQAVDTPRIGLPAQSAEELRAQSRRHPHVEVYVHLAASAAHRARAEKADAYPRIQLGLSLIETGDSGLPDDPISGKDALIVSAGLSVPLWSGNYDDAVRAAEAASAAQRARQEQTIRQMEAELAAALAEVQDSERRIRLYETTLVPQAESTLQAVLGGYQTNRSTVAAVLLAQKDLIELQLEQVRAQASHAKAWARLEFLAGAEVEHEEANHD